MTFSQTINSALRRVPAWPLYFLGMIPAVWFFYLGLTGGLGVEPIKALEQELGQFGLQLLVVVLAVTPLRKFTGVSLIKYRRALGLLVFAYISIHLFVWLVLDVQILSQIWKDILKRPFITIGMVGLLVMIPLALTSNNMSLRKLGPQRWKRLHWLTYLAAVLGAIHYVMVQKVWEVEPLLYFFGVLALLATRVKLPKPKLAMKTS